MQLNPGNLILELPGAPKDFRTTAVTIKVPSAVGRPGGDCAGVAMKTTLKMICSLALVIISVAILFAQTRKWPIIRPLEERRAFINPGQNNADTPFVVVIEDSGSVPAYKLECHTLGAA